MDTSEIFDPKTNSLQLGGNRAHGHAALGRRCGARLGDGRVLIAGGYNGLDDEQSSETFDPKTNSFTREPSMSADS